MQLWIYISLSFVFFIAGRLFCVACKHFVAFLCSVVCVCDSRSGFFAVIAFRKAKPEVEDSMLSCLEVS
jgi:hypothetical protein